MRAVAVTALLLFGLSAAAATRADECVSATLGAAYEIYETGQESATAFVLGRYQCDPLTLKLRLSAEDGETEFDLQEAFLRVDLSEAISLTFGKVIVAYDKAQFFRPLDVVQSDRLDFDIRDSSGTLAGLPLVSLAHFGPRATTQVLVSRDFENDPDGANLGLDQVVISRAGVAGATDYALTLRYASGLRDTLSLGATATVPINDFALLYGTAVLQRNVRRFDKILALELTGDLDSARDTWFPQLALGVVVNPPFDAELTLTFEAFHDGTGLTDWEWAAIGRGFGPVPYLRQNYLALSAQRSFGPVDGLISGIHNLDDGSTSLLAGAQYTRERLSLDIGADWSFGAAGTEFDATGTSAFLEIRIDL